MSRDPRAPTSMDSDIRAYTIRDPRANINVAQTASTTIPQMTTTSQSVQPTRPQVTQQPPKSGTSSDNEKVIFISCDKTMLLERYVS